MSSIQQLENNTHLLVGICLYNKELILEFNFLTLHYTENFIKFVEGSC